MASVGAPLLLSGVVVDDDALLVPVADPLGDVTVLNPEDVAVELALDAPLDVLGVKVGKMLVLDELEADEPPTIEVDVTWSAVVVREPVNDEGIACVEVSEATGEEKDPVILSKLLKCT